MACATRHRSISSPRSSNRTCGFPAAGSPTGFTSRPTVDGQFGLVSRDDTLARDRSSPCGRALSEASGYFQVLQGSSPITDPRLLRNHTRSQGPFRRRHDPASTVLWPCPAPARSGQPSEVTLRPLPRPQWASPNYPDHLPDVPCPIPNGSGQMRASVASPFHPAFPEQTGESASTTSLSRPAQASLTLLREV